MHEELIEEEIQLAENECCIVFDFGCLFPYSNVEILKFEFQLGLESFDDYKMNHRYQNKGYQTISKKNGRKVSELGYPYVFNLSEQSLMLLVLKVGFKEKYITLVFPLETKMTKEKPVCVLSMHYIFDDNKFIFTSNEKAKDGEWYCHRWLSEPNDIISKMDRVLVAPIVSNHSDTLMYQDVITPYALTIEDLWI